VPPWHRPGKWPSCVGAVATNSRRWLLEGGRLAVPSMQAHPKGHNRNHSTHTQAQARSRSAFTHTLTHSVFIIGEGGTTTVPRTRLLA
jgi:hypothetical protein